MKKTLVITGGNKGIGAAISRVFYDAGYAVIIGARTDNQFAQTLGKGAYFFSMDVKNSFDHEALVDVALQKTGRLDCFINNAGFSKWSSLETISDVFLNEMIDTNLKSVFFGCRAAVKKLFPLGNIINISSLAGKRGTVNNSAYCATKFAVNGITQALAKELGVRGIRVNAICPVFIKTAGLVNALKENDSPVVGDVDSFLNNFIQTQSALKRLPTTQEIAHVCLFLASEAASAITGQCLNVDCGVLPQ